MLSCILPLLRQDLPFFFSFYIDLILLSLLLSSCLTIRRVLDLRFLYGYHEGARNGFYFFLLYAIYRFMITSKSCDLLFINATFDVIFFSFFFLSCLRIPRSGSKEWSVFSAMGLDPPGSWLLLCYLYHLMITFEH